MANYFPPNPVYPKSYDSDYTLFLVYNTSETVTSTDNLAWSDTVLIKPVDPDKPEIWSENGFANINGELFYYDAVEKDAYGKINKFKRCARNLGGKETKFNAAGAEVRGFVIAEHHNQLIDAVINLENFIGYDFTPTLETLDYRIRNLRALTVIFDDFTCPDITFTFNVISSDPVSGSVAQYSVLVNGSYTSFRLDFGDGQFTDSTLIGQHQYAANSTIDPIVTISNELCTITTSPKERVEANEPTITEPTTTIDITLPNFPEFPPFVYPDVTLPSYIINLPPIVFPCLDIGPISPINIPSVIILDPPLPSSISITPLYLPSRISLTPFGIMPSIVSLTPFGIVPSIVSLTPFGIVPSIVSLTPFGIVPSRISITPFGIIPSTVSITPFGIIPSKISITPVSIPSVISIVPFKIPDVKITPITIPDIKISPPNIPPITVTPPVIPPISIVPPNIPPITVDFGNPPTIPVDWGSPPTVSCEIKVSCPAAAARAKGFDSLQDNLEEQALEVEIADIGIPSEIKIIAPEIPDIQILSDIPERIKVEAINIPSSIKIDAGKFSLPSEIKIIADEIPTKIEIVSKFEIPSRIDLIANLPSSIKLDLADNFPSVFKLEAIGIPEKIQVTGIPSTIELVGAPSEIKLVMPEKPEIEMVYKGAPIDVKINLDVSKLTGENENLNCVAIVPCKP